MIMGPGPKTISPSISDGEGGIIVEQYFFVEIREKKKFSKDD